MADATVLFAVRNLDELLILQNAGFLQGIEEQVKQLRDELKRIQCFLRDAAEKQDNDKRIPKWISEIRDVAQDAGYVIEEFIIKSATATNSNQGSSGNKLPSLLPKRSYDLYKVGRRIKRMLAKLRDVERSFEKYGIQNRGEERDNVERRAEFSAGQKHKHLVGMEEEVEWLLREGILDEEKEGLSIATIVGPDGVGKSTLAGKVYSHAAVADRFDRRAWVVVHDGFTAKDVIKELMLQLLDPAYDRQEEAKSMDDLPLESIQEYLHKCLNSEDGRFLILLDDVREDAHWESIATVFTDQDKGSRLLLTSRNPDIAKHAANYVHEMKISDPNKSLELFLKKALIGNVEGEFPEDLDSVGREILKKCDGLPLAIALVGGLLGDKLDPTKSEWEKVLEQMNAHLGRSGTSSLSTILELSYRDLSPQLKSCFLCLGLFTEDVPIPAKKLVHVWVALGLFPLQGGEETKEELATLCLDELIRRNLVQVNDLTADGRVKNCHTHDLIRKLSITKANEEIGLQIVRQDGSSRSLLDKPRHITINDDGVYYKIQLQHLHSLFFPGGGQIMNDGPAESNCYHLLKILDLENLPVEELPESIGSLFWLRYLGLRNTKIKGLPSSVGNLKRLEVLDLKKIHDVEVDDVIWKIASLRHLYAHSMYSKYLLHTDDLKNLQTLGYVLVDNLMPDHLVKMNSLRKLSLSLLIVHSDFEKDKYYPALAMMENLVCLELKWSGMYRIMFSQLQGINTLHRLTRLKLHGRMSTFFTGANEFPPNLTHLTLLKSNHSGDPMPVLEKLPKLLYLKLDGVCYVEMVVSEDGFPQLEVLILRNLPNVQNIRFGKGAVPELKRLEIYRCSRDLVANLPEELRVITTVLPS